MEVPVFYLVGLVVIVGFVHVLVNVAVVTRLCLQLHAIYYRWMCTECIIKQTALLVAREIKGSNINEVLINTSQS